MEQAALERTAIIRGGLTPLLALLPAPQVAPLVAPLLATALALHGNCGFKRAWSLAAPGDPKRLLMSYPVHHEEEVR